MKNKKHELESIAGEIKKCRKCRKNTSGLPVPGEGNPNARIMFIGEAPGRQEALSGRPFVGRSGKLLTKLIEEIGIKRNDVYITSPVKYYPGQRAPTRAEIEHGKIHLKAQIGIIKPKLIVLLGNTALTALLDKDFKVTKDHGKVIYKNNISFFVTFHPAAALRFPKNLSLIKKDFRKLKNLINKK